MVSYKDVLLCCVVDASARFGTQKFRCETSIGASARFAFSAIAFRVFVSSEYRQMPNIVITPWHDSAQWYLGWNETIVPSDEFQHHFPGELLHFSEDGLRFRGVWLDDWFLQDALFLHLRIMHWTIPYGCKSFVFFFFDCFSGRKSLSSVVFESWSKLTRIEEGAFDGYPSLKSTYIPRSATVLSPRCFHDCTSLSSFKFQSESQIYVNVLKAKRVSIRVKFYFCHCWNYASVGVWVTANRRHQWHLDWDRTRL
jgi:hypothetical protein